MLNQTPIDWVLKELLLALIRVQEDPMATLEIPESATTQTFTSGRYSSCSSRWCSGEAEHHDKGCGEVEG